MLDLLTAIRQGNKVASSVINFLDKELGATRKSETSSDTFSNSWQSLYDIQKGPRIEWGKVADCIPLYNLYKVVGESGNIHVCTLGALSGFRPISVKQNTTIPVGSAVYFIIHPQSSTGTIVSVDPEKLYSSSETLSDYVVQAGHSGFYVDRAHKDFMTRLLGSEFLPYLNAGRAVDSTTIGEWGFGSETGLAIHLDPFMGYMRVDEETGLFMFYHDQLTRLAGHNLQIRTSVSETEELDDQQELTLVRGETPYPWETKGAWDWCQKIHKEQNVTSKSEYGILEPILDNQQPWYRHQRFGGYLGQADKEIVTLAPTTKPASNQPNKYDFLGKFNGVFQSHKALDGSYGLESAKRIVFSKRSAIPVPKLIERPESDLGDKETNYKASGIFGAGGAEAHVIKSDFEVGNSEGPIELVRAAAVLDLTAFIFNWQSIHPFHYHRLDWYVPEENELTLKTIQAKIDYCSLINTHYLTAPEPIELEVDHRYGNAKYYPNQSDFIMAEDGSIVIADGFGSEIRMVAGDINISAANNINIMPGKNLNIWAGWDFIARANNSADITANRHDVRIKAEKNVQILGGNNGYGGVLIESKAICPKYDFTELGEQAVHSGITLLSRQSPIITYSADLLLSTKEVLEDEEKDIIAQPGSGNIVIRASESNRDVKIYCKREESFLKEARLEYFDNSVNEYWDCVTQFGGSVRTKGRIVASEGLTSGGWIVIVGGHVSSDKANEYSGLITNMTDNGVTQVNEELDYIETRDIYLSEIKLDRKLTDYENVLIDGAEVSEVSLRITQDYKTEGLIIFESRWQQLARLGMGVPNTWIEHPVISLAGDKTYPHPGKEVWTGDVGNEDESLEANFYTQNLGLFDIFDVEHDGVGGGMTVDREKYQSAYENPEFAVTCKKVLDGNYPIIRN